MTQQTDRTWPLSDLSVEELIQLSIEQTDGNVASLEESAFYEICWNRRVVAQAWELVRGMHASSDYRERSLYAWMAWNLEEDPPFREEAATTLVAMLETETHPDTLHSIGVALGYLGDVRVIEPLLRFKNHPDGRVRYGVAWGLRAHECDRSVEGLIELSGDPDQNVRGEATWALAEGFEADTPTVRDALAARLTDGDRDARGYGLVGLALRKDARVLESLRRELPDAVNRNYPILAAIALGDLSLRPALLELRERMIRERVLDGGYVSLVDEALAACAPDSDAPHDDPPDVD